MANPTDRVVFITSSVRFALGREYSELTFARPVLLLATLAFQPPQPQRQHRHLAQLSPREHAMVFRTRQIARKVPSFVSEMVFWENLLASIAQPLATLASRPPRRPWATGAFRQGVGLVRNAIKSVTGQAPAVVPAGCSARLVPAKRKACGGEAKDHLARLGQRGDHALCRLSDAFWAFRAAERYIQISDVSLGRPFQLSQRVFNLRGEWSRQMPRT